MQEVTYEAYLQRLRGSRHRWQGRGAGFNPCQAVKPLGSGPAAVATGLGRPETAPLGTTYARGGGRAPWARKLGPRSVRFN
jgi:hypothetical protein